jgi:S-adenosylmethionine hydrolase
MAGERPAPVVALLTDFGTRDGFVGAMKAAALSVNPRLAFVDVSHEIAPQGILEGALVLQSVFPYFPEGTIFVAVVDPGVGTARAVLAARIAGRLVLAPDNGLASPVLEESAGAGAATPVIRRVTESRYFRPVVQPTFHGRDLFAPVAAHLSLGIALEELGPPAGEFVRLAVPRPERSDAGLAAVVLHVDRFGNLVTNVTARDLEPLGGAGARIVLAGQTIEGLSTSYALGASPLAAMVGSWGYVEIALRDGSAASALGAGRGTRVLVHAARAANL